MMTLHQLCLGHHGGVSGVAETPRFSACTAHTEHLVLSLPLDDRPNVPPPARSQAGDLAGKYGAWAVSQVIPRGSNSVGDGPCPPPGDSTLGTLSQDRSPPITPGSPSSAVTPGESVRPVQTGQKAQLEKADQCLAQSELPVLNSPDRSVQLEHNVHEQPGNMPNLQIEHLSEYSQVFQDFTISDSPDVRADESPERTHLQDSGHQSSGIGHTSNPLGTGHTGNHSDRERSVRRSGSVRSDAIEHGSDRTRHRSDVSRSSRRDKLSHRETIPLQHADPGELSPALMIRHRPARSRSSSYDSVSPRRHSRSSSRSRGKKKSHKKRKHSSTSSSSSCRSSSYSSRERERKRHKSKKKKKKHSKSRSSKHDKREKKHKRKRSPTPFPSSSSSSVSLDSSSSLRRSPARKKSRINSRSPSPADDNPHSAFRTSSQTSHQDHLSLCADNDDEYNSPSEDNQDLAPDTEMQDVSQTHSEVSTDDMKFQILVEEVLKLLPADMFPRKTDEFPGGNRPRSSIELEMQKVTKKSISLPQSRRPLMKAVDCLKESLGASKVDDSFPMPPTITQDWVPSKADSKKLVQLRYYQAHEFLPTATASALDSDAVRLGMSLTGSYPVKITAIKDLETHSRDIIRLLSHAETFSFAAFKSPQSENMDTKVLLEILKSMSGAITDAMSIATAQTLGLQQLRPEAAIDSAPRGSLTEEAKRKLCLPLSPLNFCLTGRLVPFIRRIWLKTRRPL